jgi:hypothetical protein
VLSLEGDAPDEQEAPEPDGDDLAEARDTVREARGAAARGEL